MRLSVKQFIDKFWPTPAVGNLPPIPSQNPFADVVSLVANKAVEKDVADAFVSIVALVRSASANSSTPGRPKPSMSTH